MTIFTTLLQRGPQRSLLLLGMPSIPTRQAHRSFSFGTAPRFARPGIARTLQPAGAHSTWARLLHTGGAEVERSATAPPPLQLPHVLAQHPDLPRAKRVSYMPGASVDDLIEAVIVKLELGVTFADVNLCLEKGKPLCGLTQVETLGITAGAVVYVERVETILKMRWRAPEGMQERETKQLFTSAADFTLFVAAHRVDHIVVDNEGGHHSQRISSLSQAVKASLSEGGHLLVSDTLSMLGWDSISSLKARRKNTPDAFVGETNRAVAQCQALRDKFGPLEALGGGRGVVFVEDTGDDFMECDGLFKTAAGVLVVNEAKMHFTAADAKALAGSFLGKLQLVLASTAFTSNPPEVIAHMAGVHTVVLVASSPSFKAADAEECRRLGIYMLQRDGSGFQCTPPGESMGGHCRQSAARVLAGGGGKREGE